MTAAEKNIPEITPGLYADTKDVIRDFGDITWTADQESLERIHDKLKDALFYLEYMQSSDPVTSQSIGVAAQMHIASLGHELVKAAWNNGYRAHNFERKAQ